MSPQMVDILDVEDVRETLTWQVLKCSQQLLQYYNAHQLWHEDCLHQLLLM